MVVLRFNSLNLFDFTLSFISFKIKYNNLSTDPSFGNTSITRGVYNFVSVNHD